MAKNVTRKEDKSRVYYSRVDKKRISGAQVQMWVGHIGKNPRSKADTTVGDIPPKLTILMGNERTEGEICDILKKI